MSIRRKISETVLTDYKKAKPHLMPEFSDDAKVAVLVTFRLGDLRALEALTEGENSILSAG